MEPDHSANIDKFISAYPEAAVVGNAKTFEMIDQFFGRGLCKNKLAVKNGDTLSLANRACIAVFFAFYLAWKPKIAYNCTMQFTRDGKELQWSSIFTL